MKKLCGIVVIIFLAGQAHALDFFGELFEGFQNTAEYKSALPCASVPQENCKNIQGAMGKALDTASSIGLDIQGITIHPEKINKNQLKIFAQTQSSGTCFVDSKVSDLSQGLKFLCSQKGLVNDELKSIDKVVVLKKVNSEFILEDITEQNNLTH